MISIDEAIIESKKSPNISDGGSACYDFGDVVLVKYTLPLKYVKPGYRARECQEIVMEGINKKANAGVNTPKHLAMKRTIEGPNDVCYVLQEKCKGINCSQMDRQTESVETVLESLKYVNSIPFSHYEKLISDACALHEMGYEAKNKNLFYDKKTGFWFIDFLDNNEKGKFDANNPSKIFEVLKYTCPKPQQIASKLNYDVKTSDEDKEKIDILNYSIKAKFFLACKNVIPTFSRYEFFYLLGEDDAFKRYLMSGTVKRDLFSATDNDFKVYEELFTSIVNDICKDISINGKQYWDVKENDIRNKSELLSLKRFYRDYIRTDVKIDDYEDEWEYNYAISESFTNAMLDSIYKTLCSMEPNENIIKFTTEYESKRKGNITI